MTTNIGVWYMIVFMISFFVITLMWEQETSFEHNAYFRDDKWTNHIIYSIWNVSSFIFTRNSRCTLLLACWMTQMSLQAVCYNWTLKDEWGWAVLFAVGSAIASKLVQFVYGHFLYNDYQLQDKRWDTLDKKVELACYLDI